MSLTSRHDTEVDELAAPAEDGGVLVWPSADRILAMVEENERSRVARALRLAGGASAPAGPLPILVGHQPEMMHPGVWIKLVAVAPLARRTGRKALFVCVDHDLTNGIPLQFPSREEGRWRTKSIPLGAPGQHAFEQEPPRSTNEWAELLNDPPNTGKRGTWSVFRDAFLSAQSNKYPSDYVSRWWHGINSLMTACGESPIEMVRVSERFLPTAPSLEDRSYPFVASILLDAGRFAASYNRALHEYRDQRGIRGDAHPIPDLSINDGRTELPFWIAQGDKPRARLYVRQDASGSVSIFSDTQAVCTLDSRRLYMEPTAVLTGALGTWRIRPRALALTMYLRLFECDLFIHGIGGAKYDVITDAIIRDFFGVEPPGYACVTATARLTLDNATSSAAEDGVVAARNRVRAARFNPQRALSRGDVAGELATALAERENSIVDARNLRDSIPDNLAARRIAFQRIRNANARINALRPDLLANAEQALKDAVDADEDRIVTHSREWFTGLYSLAQLRALCARLPW